MSETPYLSMTAAALNTHEDPVGESAQKGAEHLMVASQLVQTALHLRTASLNARAARVAGQTGEAGETGSDTQGPAEDSAPAEQASPTGMQHPLSHLLVHRPAPGAEPSPLQAAAPAWEEMLLAERGHRAQALLTAWQAAVPFAPEHVGAALAAERAQAQLRELYPDALARFDELREQLDPTAAMHEVAPLLSYHLEGMDAREHYAVMLGPEAASVDTATAVQAWAGAHAFRAWPGADEELEVAMSRAEERLRELHPQVMQRYDELRLHDQGWAVDKTIAELRTIAAAEATASVGIKATTEVATEVAGRAPAQQHSAGPGEQDQRDQQNRHAGVVREALPAVLAEAVLADEAWPRLSGALEHAERGGQDPAQVLTRVLEQRDMADAKHPAAVLAHRVQADLAASTADQPAASSSSPGTLAGTAQPMAASPGHADVPDQIRDARAADDTLAEHPAAAASLMFPTPLGSPTSDQQAPTPEEAGQDGAALAAAASLREQGQRDGLVAAQQAHTPDDVSTTRVDEHHDGVQAAVGTQHRANAELGQADVLTAQAGSPASGAPASAAASGPGSATGSPTEPGNAAQAASTLFPTPLTSAALTEAHTPASQATSAPAPAQAAGPTTAQTGARAVTPPSTTATTTQRR